MHSYGNGCSEQVVKTIGWCSSMTGPARKSFCVIRQIWGNRRRHRFERMDSFLRAPVAPRSFNDSNYWKATQKCIRALKKTSCPVATGAVSLYLVPSLSLPLSLSLSLSLYLPAFHTLGGRAMVKRLSRVKWQFRTDRPEKREREKQKEREGEDME
jgi:hypothetical protein